MLIWPLCAIFFLLSCKYFCSFSQNLEKSWWINPWNNGYFFHLVCLITCKMVMRELIRRGKNDFGWSFKWEDFKTFVLFFKKKKNAFGYKRLGATANQITLYLNDFLFKHWISIEFLHRKLIGISLNLTCEEGRKFFWS